MSSKVKCTCGWSWNKSDSSKKDMYICHECGRDNSNNISKAQDGEIMSSRNKRGIDLLIKETEKANKDKQELVSTGQIKNPRSIQNKKNKKELEKKQTYVKQDTRSDYVKKLDQEKGQAIEDKKQLKKNVIAPLDVATDIMQLGNFVPNPIGQTIGKIGNVAGAAIDAYQAYDDLSEENYTDAAINAGSVFLPMGLDSKTFRRNSKYLQPGQPLYPLSPQARGSIDRVNYIEPFNNVKGMTDTSLLANRALLGTLGAETIYDASAMSSEPEVTPIVDKDKTIQYYNTDPKRGQVEKPGKLTNVQYVPISNSVQLNKWKEQEGELKNGGWLDNYNDSQASAPEGFQGDGFSNVGRDYSPAWGGQFQMGGNVYPVNYVPQAAMGGSIPGAVGFSYARTQGAAPSNGKYAKKTLPSAQNGQEMQYYREGLDFQPKTISRDGSELQNIEQAQNGVQKNALSILDDVYKRKQKGQYKNVKIKDERKNIATPAISTNVKKRDLDLEQSRSNKTYYNTLAEQKKEDVRRKGLTQDQREREDYNIRNEQTGTIQEYVPESTWDRTKAIASNPLTAFGYAARNQSLPSRFQHGERNTLDNAIDWVNPLQGVAALSEIPGELGRGEYLNAGLSALDALDLGVYAKGAMKASKPFLQKAGTALGTESGLLSNTYKHNPWAFKPNESNYYRQVSKEAIDDALSSKIIREKGEIVSSENLKKFNNQIKDLTGQGNYADYYEKAKAESLAKGHGPMPYFQKGSLFFGDKKLIKTAGPSSIKGIQKGKKIDINHLIESDYPSEAFQNAYAYKFSPGNTTEVGGIGVLKPDPNLRNIDNFKIYKKDWLQGYKEIPKQEDGGIIKDDRGQWDHPGEITEIGSNEITMEGVPYDVLGISDTGDTKLMKPGKNYKFKGKKVTEYPMAKNGVNQQDQKTLQQLDQLTNFTNYNKQQPAGWLNKYN